MQLRKIWPWLLILFLSIPLFFIRVNQYHDWGDDFAQYLLQAGLMTGNHEFSLVGQITSYGPPVKGLLFSVSLIPSVLLSGDEILISKITVTASLVFFSLTVFGWFRKDFGVPAAVIMAMTFLYHFQIIRIKDQILPDFWFSAFVVLAILFFEKGGRQNLFFAVFLALIAYGFKSAGLALVAAMTMTLFLSKLNTLKSKLTLTGLSALGIVLFLFAERMISGGIPSTLWYSMVTVRSGFNGAFTENATIYYEGLLKFLEFEIPAWMNGIIRIIILTGFVAGFFLSVLRKPGTREWFVVFYLIFLMLYPYNRDPLRFLLPLLPFVFWYFLHSARTVHHLISRFRIEITPLILSLLLFVAVMKTFSLEIKREMVYEPFDAESRELFDFLRQNIPAGKTVSDTKPWALAYWAGVNTVPFGAAYNADYLVLRIGTSNLSVFSGGNEQNKVFSNGKYVVIRQ